MNTFGKSGIGNESTYNSGYKLCRFIALSYGSDKLKEILINLSSPLQFSVNNAIKKAIGITGYELYEEYKKSLSDGYQLLTKNIKSNISSPNIIIDKGTANMHPTWSPDGSMVAFQGWHKGGWKIFYVLATGGPAERLTNSTQWTIETGPSWSSRLR